MSMPPRKVSFYVFEPTIVRTATALQLRVPRLWRVVGTIWIAVLTGMTVDFSDDKSALGGLLLIVVFAIPGLWLLLMHSNLTCCVSPPSISVSHGIFPFIKKWEIDRASAKVELVTCRGRNLQYSVILHTRDCDVTVAASEHFSRILPAVQALQEFIAASLLHESRKVADVHDASKVAAGFDDSQATVRLSDGRELTTSVALCAPTGISLSAGSVTNEATGRIVMQLDRRIILPLGILLAAAGTGAFALAWTSYDEGYRGALAIPVVVGVVFGGLGVLIMVDCIRKPARIEVDPDTTTVRVWDSALRTFSRGEMACIQFCAGAVYPSEGAPFDGFQCNFVLSNPPGDRINLLNGMHEDFVRGYTLVVAGALRLQIVDLGNRTSRQPSR